MKGRIFAFVASLVLAGLPSVALAQHGGLWSAEPEDRAGRPFLLPGWGPSNYQHDGFFYRFGLGFSELRGDLTAGGATRRAVSPGMCFDVSMGGTPLTGLVVGVGLWHASTWSSTLTDMKIDNAKVTLFTLFVDFYPWDTEGLHAQMAVGSTMLEYISGDDKTKHSVFGVAPGLGYEFWIARQLSLGPLLRVLYAPSASIGDVAGRPLTAGPQWLPQLLLAVTYH